MASQSPIGSVFTTSAMLGASVGHALTSNAQTGTAIDPSLLAQWTGTMSQRGSNVTFTNGPTGGYVLSNGSFFSQEAVPSDPVEAAVQKAIRMMKE